MRTILITGATSGLGRFLARRLAAPGVRVIVHGRDPARLRETVAEVTELGGQAEGVLADLSGLRAVEAMADELVERFDRLDALVNNAGIGYGRPGAGRQESEDGVELRFAVNYLAGFHLTRRLLPLLRVGAPARVVNVASAGQHPVDFDDPMLIRGYSARRAYGQSKLAQIMFTFDLAEELAGEGVRVNALHPATLMDTGMVGEAGIAPVSSLEEGGAATLRLVNDLGGVTGRYFDGSRDSRADPQAYDPKARARLRALSDELVRAALG
ncbi:3-oxoacyl-ACP reductase [Microtetraspora sp. NBRC 13810]|uniref:SDR family NAD(P)-dependent oxidoreductase n=1 Tax=Microtetraspora sp. NBRC 13810 TaxID=3030990 RepID=UPI0024A44B76|nr:SDR family NAD(P)-dependent oxidoreductase [Microtetraspora sp. NBRC 13810]GLW07980.1 3-oxoacyl-ACP reductase [Microtetraspora sp. NBRC 13810]